MGGSRIFDWGGPHIEKARDDGQKVALNPLKSWPIGGGHVPVGPPPWNRPWFTIIKQTYTGLPTEV